MASCRGLPLLKQDSEGRRHYVTRGPGRGGECVFAPLSYRPIPCLRISPIVRGPAYTAPGLLWTWARGGGGGNGVFKLGSAVDDPSKGTGNQRSRLPRDGTAGGIHTLFGSNGDEREIGLLAGRFAIRIDQSVQCTHRRKRFGTPPLGGSQRSWVQAVRGIEPISTSSQQPLSTGALPRTIRNTIPARLTL